MMTSRLTSKQDLDDVKREFSEQLKKQRPASITGVLVLTYVAIPHVLLTRPALARGLSFVFLFVLH